VSHDAPGGSLFSQIARGEIPCHRVWEDDDHLAFLDIRPLSPGHTLVIPKVERDDLFDLEPRRAEALWAAAHAVAARLKAVTGCARVAVLVLGYEVPHAHIHLIPTESEREVLSPTRAPTDHAALAALAARLRGAGAEGGAPPALPTTEATRARWDELARGFVARMESTSLRAAHAALDQLRLGEAARVLEVGCGGGAAGLEARARLTAALAARGLPPSAGRVTLTDLSPVMVELAAAAAAGVEGVEVREADAQALPFARGAFDRYLSCLSLMLVPDPAAALAEAARVLAPGGVGAWVVWGRPSHSPLMTLLPEAAARVGVRLPPVARSNFHLGGLDRLRRLLAAAGFERARLWYHQMPTAAETGEEVADVILTDRPELRGVYETPAQEAALRAELARLAQGHLDAGRPVGLDTLIAVARRA